MVMEIEALSRKFAQNGHLEIAAYLDGCVPILRKLGIPEYFTDEIPAVSEKLYKKTREALAERGLTFVVSIDPSSIFRLAAGEKTGSLFEYINPSEKMRSNVPPQIEIAIDPNHFRIEGSNNLSTDDQFEKIGEREAILKGELPEDVKDIISMLRPKHASILVQLDFEYQKQTGKVLFTDWFGRTDDQTVPGGVADVGRDVPSNGLDVSDWHRDGGRNDVFAVSAVVLPRKSAV